MKRPMILSVLGMFVILAATALGLVPSVAEGAVPQLINFQGILKDGSGNPVADGNYDVTFKIYDAAVGGAVLYSKNELVTTTNGLFSVIIGTSLPIPDSAFNSSNRWLGFAVSPDPEMTPRQQLVSVGYAYRVSSVDGALGGTINGAIDAPGMSSKIRFHYNDVSEFPSASTYHGMFAHAHNQGAAYYAHAAQWVRLADSAHPHSSLAASDLSPNPALSVDADGNVGIGTATPAGRLDVAGGNVNLEISTAAAGNILKAGVPFIHNFGINNMFIGRYAGNLTMTGRGNTASGDSALASNTTGHSNTASGAFALLKNATGSVNTASGRDALFSNTTGEGNTASGVSALGSNTTGHLNTASGVFALLNNTTGHSNTASGFLALQSNKAGYYNTAVGDSADVSDTNLTNATAIGAHAIVTASNKIRLGDTLITVIEGQVAFTASSDKNQKENFRPVDGGEVLRKIRDFNLSSWNYKGHDPKQFRHYGPMAQEFFAAFGNDGIGKIGTETSINSGDMAGILMIAVQALEERTAEVAELKARIEALEKLQAVRR